MLDDTRNQLEARLLWEDSVFLEELGRFSEELTGDGPLTRVVNPEELRVLLSQ